MMSDKWILEHGCHKGTLTSRDIGEPSEHDTKEAAIEAYQKHRQFYASVGYQIWYARITSPDGKIYNLELNHFY